MTDLWEAEYPAYAPPVEPLRPPPPSMIEQGAEWIGTGFALLLAALALVALSAATPAPLAVEVGVGLVVACVVVFAVAVVGRLVLHLITDRKR